MTDYTSTIVFPGELRAELLQVLLNAPTELDVVAAAPSALPQTFDGWEPWARAPWKRMSIERTGNHVDALLRFLADEVDHLPQTEAWWNCLHHWIRELREARYRIRHLGREPLLPRFVCRPEATAVLAAPPRQIEQPHPLDLELVGDAHKRYRRWAEEALGRSTDISTRVQGLLEESWAGALVGPEDLYLKVLAEYFQSTLDEVDRTDRDNPMLEYLTEFQQDAYHQAKGVLRRFGGVFLADVVGLGKTFIALALLKWLQDTRREHAVVVGPPAVLPQWQQLAQQFRIELATVSVGKLSDLDDYTDREIVVVDESHNFRNAGTQRYERLQQWLRPEGQPASRRVILLSATPQNNHPRDVQRQIAFFPDGYSRLPHAGESLETYFRSVARGDANLRDLLQHIVVRRTRGFVQENYPEATIRRRVAPGEYETVPLLFPKRVSGPDQCLRYSIEAAYGGGLYDEIMRGLQNMRHPRHGLALYLQDSMRGEPRYQGLQRAGRSLRGLYRVLLLKRLESSIFAFRETIGRLRDALETMIDNLERGVVAIRAIQETTEDGDDVLLHVDEEVPASHFNASRLRSDLEHDLAIANNLFEATARLGPGQDAKLHRLEAWLRRHPPSKHKTIIFTQFADTANYISSNLGDSGFRFEVATGSTQVLSLARRFAPVSMRATVAPEDELDLLVATDVLSEGVNLQDADTLINYDLHWNPVRLIQRAGRIDRIGSENEEITVASFLPERELEQNLNLETVLRTRIDEFLRVFGEDSGVLPDNDRPDADEALTAYTGRALDQADAADSTDALSRHIERILRLRRDERERYDHLLAMRLGRRTVTAAGIPVVACRLGWFWTFYGKDEQEDPSPMDDVAGLDAFQSHVEHPIAETHDPLALGAFATAARDAFEPVAESFREQLRRPRLSAAQTFLLRALDDAREDAAPNEAKRIGALREWLLAGHAQAALERLGRRARREDYPATVVVAEVGLLSRRFSGQDSELGAVEQVALAGRQASSS